MVVYQDSSEFLIRSLEPSDSSQGYKAVLSDLTVAGNLDDQLFRQVLTKQSRSKIGYSVIAVIEKSSGNIVGSGTLVAVADIFHNGDLVGYIEDIVVLKRLQGKKLGFQIIEVLKNIARSQGCYKVELDCSAKNVAFYTKCGLRKSAIEMSLYFKNPRI